ncbi:MAG: hypothetical protein GWO24_38200, partial [Akkermansiaceae bacterium]|nr:hypothetical protein [Akkermansiaceae bacterium]
SREALELLRHTEQSGSVTVTLSEPKIVDRNAIFRILRKVPEIRTADLAYYCFALAIPRESVDRGVLTDGRGGTIILKIGLP